MARMFGQSVLGRTSARNKLNEAIRHAAGPSVRRQLSRLGSPGGISGFVDDLITRFIRGNHTVVDELRRALGGGLTNRDITRELMRGAGLLDQPEPLSRGGRGRGGGRGRTGGPPDKPPQPPPSPLQPIGQPRSSRPGAPPRPGEESPYGQEILTPQSSNVFSFSYQPETSTLYVTFKANRLNPDNVRTGRGRRGGMRQLRGRLGATVSGKTNERGPMYAYLDVPARVFQRMQLAQSKGRFVWDELRVRGTIYGHKYRYQLVQGQVVTQRGVSGVYVPRKATKQGFRVRSVATLGQGRRQFESSTLPEQIGFRSRRPPGR